MLRARRLLLVPALAVACTLGACGDDDSASTTTSSTVGSVLPPVSVDLDKIDGTTVDVPVGGVINLTGDDTTYKDWKAEIADSKLLTFVPGREEGGATFNPGLNAKEAGKTEVKLTNSSSSKNVTFTVNVTG